MSNSPFVSFLRSLIMLAMLIVILLIAVFWDGLPSMKNRGNLLPTISWKHFFQQDEEESDWEPLQETFTPTRSIPLDSDGLSDTPGEPEPGFEGIGNQFDVSPPVSVEEKLPEDYLTLKRVLEQEYGATDVLLEPWGSEGKMYRFSCYVFEPRGSSVKKLHQSIQATPALAIQKVLATVR